MCVFCFLSMHILKIVVFICELLNVVKIMNVVKIVVLSMNVAKLQCLGLV